MSLFRALVGRYPWESSSAFYTVAYGDLPSGLEAQKALEEARGRILSEVSGKLKQERSIGLGSSPGLEFDATTASETIVRARIYVVNGRLYELVVGGKPERVYAPEDGEAFLDSFRLVG